MVGAYTALAFVVGASLVVGQAILCFARGTRAGVREPLDWLAAGVGVSVLLVVAGATARLPGRGVTAGIALVAVTVAAGIYLRGRVALGRREAAAAAALVLVVVALASIPFAAAGTIGALGAGLLNDDMASHLLIADYVREPGGFVPTFIRGGYPIGPHAVVVGISELGGAGLVEVFAGFTLALPALLGLVAFGVLGPMPLARRLLGAAAVALAYLSISFVVSGAFKEPLQAIVLLCFALLLARVVAEAFDPEVEAPRVHPLRRILPLAVLAAASVFNYSLPGLLWIGAVGLAVVATRWYLVEPRPRLPDDWARRAAPYLLGAAAIVAVATAQEWSRIADFARLDALNPDRFGSDLGNLKGAISPLEALGIWPTGDYRTAAGAAGPPVLAFAAGAAVAGLALLVGLRKAWREGLHAPIAALGAIVVVWGVTAIASTPYIAAKALAIAAPVAMLISVRGILEARRPLVRGLAVLFLAGALGSSLLAVRQAPVRPGDHSSQLAEVRERLQDEEVLFLGRDNFIGWELRGSDEITGIVTNFYSVEEVRGRFQKGEGGGEKFDIDAVFPATLDSFRYILATTGGPSSSPPPRFTPVVETRDYVLYERRGRVGRRKTLDEGVEPGAVLSCPPGKPKPQAARGKGTAQIWNTEPVIARPAGWEPSADVTDARPASIELRIPAGRSLISLEYDSRRPLIVRSGEIGLDAQMPANLDFRGPSPFFPVGEIEAERPTTARIEVAVEEPNLLGRILGVPNEAHLRSISATPLGVIERTQRRRTCGAYVDWYRAR